MNALVLSSPQWVKYWSRIVCVLWPAFGEILWFTDGVRQELGIEAAGKVQCEQILHNASSWSLPYVCNHRSDMQLSAYVRMIYIISFILCKMLQALFIPVIIFISWRLQHDTLFQACFNSCWICRIYQLNSSLYKVPFNGGPFPILVAPQNGIFPLYPDSLPYST